MEYNQIIVESYYESGSGLHGPVHIRPIQGQDPYLPHMRVECPKEMRTDYPVGTQFKITAKITSRQGGPEFIYTHYSWGYIVLGK